MIGDMGRVQRRIAYAVIAAISVTLMFPPFVVGFPSGGISGIGYGFILSWPKSDGYGLVGYVDISLLLAEWLAILVVAGISWALNSGVNFPNP